MFRKKILVSLLILMSVVLVSLPALSQSTSMQAKIYSYSPNNRFCKGIPEYFQLEARASGGVEPYKYEWTFSWRSDTLIDKTIFVQPTSSGIVRLKVTDSSPSPITKESKYYIYEISVTSDFNYISDSLCAQTPVSFTPKVTGGTPDFSYIWNFGDFSPSSTEKNPAHGFVAASCTGYTGFNVNLLVSDLDGCTSSVTKTVIVKNKPYLSFSDIANPGSEFKHCPLVMTDPKFTVKLDNRSVPVTCITSYNVDWGDGNSESNVTFPKEHLYEKDGAFELIVTAENSSGCNLIWRHMVYSQNASPGVGFSVPDGSDGCAIKENIFTLQDYSKNSMGTTYTWNFGDGTIPKVWQYDRPYISDTIHHSFTKSSCLNPGGLFFITLTVANGCGGKSQTVPLSIWSKPGASINDKDLAIDTICINEKIQLENNTILGHYGYYCDSIPFYRWDLNNGTTSDNETMPPSSWPVPGIYDVMLTASNDCGETTDTFKIVVINPPVASATVNALSGCVPFSPEFVNTSTEYKELLWKITPKTGYTYLDETSSKSREPKLKFSKPGLYRMVLYVSNTCRSDSVVFNFSVYDVPSGIINNFSDLCITNPSVNPTVKYKDNGRLVTLFDWSFEGASPSSSSSEDPGLHTYSSPGEYYVNLVIGNACGNTHLTDTLIVHPVPLIGLESPVLICDDNSLFIDGTTVANADSILWQTTGDGYFSDDKILNPVYHPGVNDLNNSGTLIRLIAFAEAPCNADTALLTLVIRKRPVVYAGPDLTVCEGKSFPVTGASAINYDELIWTTSGDGSYTQQTGLITDYIPGTGDNKNGTVKLILTAKADSPCNQKVSDTLTVTLARVPVFNAGPDQDICEDGTVSIKSAGSGFTAVLWHVDPSKGNFNDNTSLNPLFTIKPGLSDTLIIVTVEAAGGFGCPSVTDTLLLRVIKLPVAIAGDDALVCADGFLELKGASVSGFETFVWKVNGDGTLSDNSVLNPVFEPGINDIASGNMTLILTAYGKSVCHEVSDIVSITIQKLPAADAGPDQFVCKSSLPITSGSRQNGATSYWKSTGTGTFANPSELITTYFPSENDKNTGNVNLILTVNATAPCSSPAYDTVRLSFIDPPVVSAGNDTTICSLTYKPLKAYSLNSNQIEWSTSGSGLFSDRFSVITEYFPSPADIDAGSVTLTLTSKNPTCPPVNDQMFLKLTPFPVVYSGADDLICEDNVKTTADSKAENYSSLEWKTTGDGNFNDISLLHPVYRPGASDVINGRVKLILFSHGLQPCNTPAVDTLLLEIQKNVLVYGGRDTIIGEREPFVAAEAYASDFIEVTWSTTGDGTFLNRSDINCTYIHGDNDLINKGVDLIVKAVGINPCNLIVYDTIHIIITPVPKADAGSNLRICEGSAANLTTASAEEYAGLWWTTTGTGTFENGTTLKPTYHPGNKDITDRKVFLILHAQGKAPVENKVAVDSMLIDIIHNAYADILKSDTACVNAAFGISNSVFRDAGVIQWSTSGEGVFSNPGKEQPEYFFATNDKSKDSIFLFLRVNSISPCSATVYDTLKLRLYHDPMPSFSYINSEGCAPLKVDFANDSEGEELFYHWDFGNGKENDTDNPGSMIFEQGRIADTTYIVTLTTSNVCNTVAFSREVTVKPIPVAGFGMNVTWGCSPREILFFNVTTGLADSYLWNWGDGSGLSIKENPYSHIFYTGESDTTYTITMIAGNDCGIDSIKKSVVILPNRVKAFFETDTTMGCAPLKVSFKNYSRGVLGNRPFLNWSWNFGDGNVSDELSPEHLFIRPGKYKVTLYVNDTCSYDSFTTVIDVMGAPYTDFVTDKQEYCVGDSVFMNPVNMPSGGIANVAWDFGDASSGTAFNETHIYNKPGIITITLTVKDIFTGCLISTSRNITINEAPATSFAIPENGACQPLDITFINNTTDGFYYSWDFGNGNSSVELNGRQIFREPGLYKVSLKASNLKGCSNTLTKEVKVNPKPIAGFVPASLLTCFPPTEVKFKNTSQGADDYLWNFGNGQISRDTDPSLIYSKYGDFPVKLIATNSYTCSDTSEMIYHVYHNPVARFNIDSVIGCDPFKVSFTNHSEFGSAYFWKFGDKGLSTEKDPVFTFAGSGRYDVFLKVIGSGGCSDSVNKTNYITVNPSPVSEFDYDKINGLDTVQFHNYSTGATGYLWNFGDGASTIEENPWHRYNHYGFFYVTLTTINEFDCENIKSDTLNFNLLKGIYIPNALSPESSSEGIRLLKAVGTGLSEYHLVVYDTWGNMIWETTKLDRGSPVEGWDGTYKGKPLPPDVYVYHLKKVVFKDGKHYEGPRYGSITLIR